jgi:hypothetical protein
VFWITVFSFNKLNIFLIKTKIYYYFLRYGWFCNFDSVFRCFCSCIFVMNEWSLFLFVWVFAMDDFEFFFAMDEIVPVFVSDFCVRLMENKYQLCVRLMCDLFCDFFCGHPLTWRGGELACSTMCWFVAVFVKFLAWKFILFATVVNLI